MGIHVIDETHCNRLVGIATDGASANIAAGGLKGLVETKLIWIFWMWYLAHRIELAIKDTLTGTAFQLIDEMLLRLYYLYEKSPKKCRELEEIVSDLKECLQFEDGGIKPIRASGSRWVNHKLAALKYVLSKYGAYTMGCRMCQNYIFLTYIYIAQPVFIYIAAYLYISPYIYKCHPIFINTTCTFINIMLHL